MKRPVLLLGLAAAFSLPAAESRPNILFLLADDLGWGDLSCHGHPAFRTPHLDRLAREGADFHQFNVASPVCSPSRVAFMTGRFPARISVHHAIGGISKNLETGSADWLDPAAPSLPRLLRDAGYATGHFGKWHLCSSQAEEAPLPEAYGLDEAALIDGTSPRRSEGHIDYHEVFEAAADFVRRNRGRPFFAKVWMHETHLAHHPSEDSMRELGELGERERVYAAVVRDADRGVGRILDLLDELGLAESTLVIFSSDNGPENTHPSQKEMRGGYGGYYSVGEPGGKGRKRSLHEGGVRVPLLARWPGRIPAGHVDTDSVLAAVDFLPTLCAAAGVDLAEEAAGDGENVLSVWLGERRERSKPLFWDWRGTDRPETNWPRGAVREGAWKLLVDDADRAELYRVDEDRLEERDLATAHPEIVSALRAKLERWRTGLPREPDPATLSRLRERRGAGAGR